MVLGGGGFMADACRVSTGRHPTPSLDPVHAEDGWQVVAHRKQWRQIAIQAISSAGSGELGGALLQLRSP
jgi:hypothetical protein